LRRAKSASCLERAASQTAGLMAEIPDRARLPEAFAGVLDEPVRAVGMAVALRASVLLPRLGDQAQVRVLARGCRFWGGFAAAGQ
jgi:hypothetical protein